MTTPNTTEALIAKLAPQGRATRILASGRVLMLQLTALALLTVFTMVVCCGLRGDWTHFMMSWDCLTHVGGWVAVGALSAFAVAGLARPRWPLSQMAVVSLAMGALLAAALLISFVGEAVRHTNGPQVSWSDFAIVCAAIVTATTLFAGFGAGVALRRAAPSAPRLFAFALGLVGSSAGMVAIGLVCEQHGAHHLLMAHVVPAVVMAGVIGVVSWWVSRW